MTTWTEASVRSGHPGHTTGLSTLVRRHWPSPCRSQHAQRHGELPVDPHTSCCRAWRRRGDSRYDSHLSEDVQYCRQEQQDAQENLHTRTRTHAQARQELKDVARRLTREPKEWRLQRLRHVWHFDRRILTPHSRVHEDGQCVCPSLLPRKSTSLLHKPATSGIPTI